MRLAGHRRRRRPDVAERADRDVADDEIGARLVGVEVDGAIGVGRPRHGHDRQRRARRHRVGLARRDQRRALAAVPLDHGAERRRRAVGGERLRAQRRVEHLARRLQRRTAAVGEAEAALGDGDDRLLDEAALAHVGHVGDEELAARGVVVRVQREARDEPLRARAQLEVVGGAGRVAALERAAALQEDRHHEVVEELLAVRLRRRGRLRADLGRPVRAASSRSRRSCPGRRRRRCARCRRPTAPAA